MSTITLSARRLVARAMQPRSIASLAVAFFTATTIACGGKDAGGPSTPTEPSSPSGPSAGAIVGSYSLEKVDGSGLPATIFDDDVRLDDGRVVRLKVAVTSGSLNLDENEEFSGKLAVKLTADGQSQSDAIPIRGEYSRSGNTISFESDDDGPSFKGTIRNGALELELDIFDTGEATTYTFKK